MQCNIKYTTYVNICKQVLMVASAANKVQYCKTLNFREHFMFAQIRESARLKLLPHLSVFANCLDSTFAVFSSREN